MSNNLGPFDINELAGSIGPYPVNIPSTPHGHFCNTENQTSAGTTSANAITYNCDAGKVDITHSTSVNPSRIYVDKEGTYLITFSICVSASGVNKHVNVWLRVNGEDIINSNTRLETPLSGEVLFTVTMLQDLEADDYIELMWCSRDDANMVLLATAAGEDPVTPVSPSIILTINRV